MNKNTKLNINTTKPIYEFTAEDARRVTLSTGNSKIGKMLNWSTLPGNESNQLIAKGRVVTNVTGTCSLNCNGCFKKCYARRSILQHHNSVTRPWTENTLMIRHKTEECFRLIDQEIHEKNKRFYQTGNPADLTYTFFRINVSGELQSVEELEHWNDLAKAHPELNFGLYSKNTPVLLGFFKKHKQTADNLCVNVSEWHGTMAGTIQALKLMGAKFNVFEYDDSNLSSATLSVLDRKVLEEKTHCKAVTKEGHHYLKPDGTPLHCSECQRCYKKTGKTTAVYSH